MARLTYKSVKSLFDKIGFAVERETQSGCGAYAVWSNEHMLGTTIGCETLQEVMQQYDECLRYYKASNISDLLRGASEWEAKEILEKVQQNIKIDIKHPM